MNDKSPASTLKEQLALIGMLGVLIGTVYTDSYYSGFGLRYQSLSLPRMVKNPKCIENGLVITSPPETLGLLVGSHLSR
jgi:hypothetical protein